MQTGNTCVDSTHFNSEPTLVHLFIGLVVPSYRLLVSILWTLLSRNDRRKHSSNMFGPLVVISWNGMLPDLPTYYAPLI